MILGIDYGASRLKAVVLDEDHNIVKMGCREHHGGLDESLSGLLAELDITGRPDVIGWTGLSSEKDQLQGCRIYYTEGARALLTGAGRMVPEAGSVLDAGAQKCLLLDGLSGEGELLIDGTSGCSAGTGSFFEEQVDRLGFSMEQLPELLTPVERVPRIAGRCSVFARTDIIHRQQEGWTTSELLHGLALSVAKSLSGNLFKGRSPAAPLFLSGGLVHNPAFVEALGKILGENCSVIASDNSDYLCAAGAAIEAVRVADSSAGEPSVYSAPPAVGVVRGSRSVFMPLAPFGAGDSDGKHNTQDFSGNPDNLLLGIDIGSTSINIVLLDERFEVVDYVYVPNRGEPDVVIELELGKLRAKYGFSKIRACVTGSGRRRIAAMLGIDLVRDEITAQARGAGRVYGDDAVIFEIGGQDSKYINYENGRVADFRMNRVCAAGTGAFLEEQAAQLGVDLRTFVELALQSKSPVELDENCTVFMRSSVVSELKKGTDKADIAAGLCYAVVRNYLKRVAAGWGGTEQTILLQGGIAYNQAVVNAFRLITGKQVIVPPFFSVTGAIGAALCAAEESAVLRKPDRAGIKDPTASYNRLLSTGRSALPDKKGRRIRLGIPRVLFMFKLFPMFNAFFSALGCEVILSGETDDSIIAEAQSFSTGEACYPVKLIIGHVASLIEQGVDMIFMPSLITMQHEGSIVRKDFACLMMQSAPHLIESVFDLKSEGVRLLSTRMNMSTGKKALVSALFDIGRQLGMPKPRIAAAAAKGAAAMVNFQRKLHRRGSDWLAAAGADEPAFVIVSRPYGLHDRELNKGIPVILSELGEKMISLTELPIESYGLDEHPNMYWPFGQHILKGVEAVLERDNLHLIFLTNHGCGPDTILLHYVDEKMNGRPYLHIEIDEHASGEGIRTRVEAFVNSVRSSISRKSGGESVAPGHPGAMVYHLPPDEDFFVPPLFSPRADTLISSGPDDIESMVRTKEDPALKALWSAVGCSLACDLPPSKLLLPVNEGASPDGQYARLIRLWLDKRGRTDVEIFSPYMEDLPDLPEETFRVIAEDLVRTDLQRRLVDAGEAAGCRTMSLPELSELAEEAEGGPGRSRKSVLITGDPWIIADTDWILTDIVQPLRRAGYKAMRMSLSEMMLFFWTDRKGDSENLGYLRQLTEKYCNPELSMERLRRKADELLPEVSGGHLRYLAAKGFCECGSHAGMIHAAGLYDNGATILMQLGGGRWTSFPYKGPDEPADPKIMDHLLLKLEDRKLEYARN